MINLIAFIIFLIGLGGMGIIITRSAPRLAKLTLAETKIGLADRIKSSIQNNGAVKRLSFDILLQKLLSKIRVLTLRTEHKTGAMLQQLRQKSLEKKKKLADDYWQKIRRKK